MTPPSFLDLISFGSQGWGAGLAVGAAMTLALAICSLGIGLMIGTCGAWAKISGGPTLRGVADTYTTVIRGIPDLLFVYLFYYGSSAVLTGIGQLMRASGFIGIPVFLAGALAIGVTSGALSTEVFRGAFAAVNRGELEAATACGMSPLLRFRRIVGPLVLRHALPSLGNVWQGVLKESALVSVIGLTELLRTAQVAAGSTSRPFDFFFAASALYLIVTVCSGWTWHKAEHHFSRGVRRV